MSKIILEEIHNLQEIIDDCLNDIPVTDPMVDVLKEKYDHSLGMLQKSLHTDFYMGRVLAYKELLKMYGVLV